MSDDVQDPAADSLDLGVDDRLNATLGALCYQISKEHGGDPVPLAVELKEAARAILGRQGDA